VMRKFTGLVGKNNFKREGSHGNAVRPYAQA
jgi:hypothetical protein